MRCTASLWCLHVQGVDDPQASAGTGRRRADLVLKKDSLHQILSVTNLEQRLRAYYEVSERQTGHLTR